MNSLPTHFMPTEAPRLPQQAPASERKPDPALVHRAAREFEAFFIGQMLEHMFKGVPTDGFFGGGQSEAVYRSMLLQQYGRIIAERGGIGIADVTAREILKTQEVQ